MVFVFANDDGGLEVFPTKDTAIASCEGTDVEAGNYLFWDENGNPLQALFSIPNERGRFSIWSGTYDLLPSSVGDTLLESLSKVRYLDSNDRFSSVEAVRRHLTGK